MSYDLFSLTFVPRQEDRNIVDLVDPNGTAYYTKRRVATSEYRIEVYGASYLQVPLTTGAQYWILMTGYRFDIDLQQTPSPKASLPLFPHQAQPASTKPSSCTTLTPSSSSSPRACCRSSGHSSGKSEYSAALFHPTSVQTLTVTRHDFEWKREECFMVRKPDPAVLVAQTKEPPGKLQTRNVQILDYNINR